MTVTVIHLFNVARGESEPAAPGPMPLSGTQFHSPRL